MPISRRVRQRHKRAWHVIPRLLGASQPHASGSAATMNGVVAATPYAARPGLSPRSSGAGLVLLVPLVAGKGR